MSRQRYVSILAKACLASLLLAFASGVSACDEDGKTAPERCADPPLPIFDIQAAGAPADDNAQYPCSTPIGHAVNFDGSMATAGAGSGGMSGGEGGGMATAGAGAGGAP
jgi:hypothetical protein